MVKALGAWRGGGHAQPLALAVVDRNAEIPELAAAGTLRVTHLSATSSSWVPGTIITKLRVVAAPCSMRSSLQLINLQASQVTLSPQAVTKYSPNAEYGGGGNGVRAAAVLI